VHFTTIIQTKFSITFNRDAELNVINPL